MTSDLLDQNWILSPKSASSRVAEETVLLHLESGLYFGLDTLGTKIWQSLGGETSLGKLCASIAEDYGAPIDHVRADARSFLAKLAEHGLIERI